METYSEGREPIPVLYVVVDGKSDTVERKERMNDTEDTGRSSPQRSVNDAGPPTHHSAVKFSVLIDWH